MKIMLTIACGLLLAVASAALSIDKIDPFVTANDTLDMQAVVDDPAKLKTMTDCFMDRGPCDVVSQSFKVIAPEAISQSCRRCNEAQKHLANIYYTGLRSNRPEDYEKFWDKYDPKRIYIDSFMKAIKNY